jgi:predicted anti-sigma-YlaC factor YlaD
MIHKDQCGIVRDLMPLVIDDVASEESKKLVEAHLPECPGCSSIMNDMRAEMKTGQANEKDERSI